MGVELDHTNRPVPADEGPDTAIKVWQVEPCHRGRFDHVLIRGWQAMLDHLRDTAEHVLEDVDCDEELTEGKTFTVRLRTMTRQEYDDLDTD